MPSDEELRPPMVTSSDGIIASRGWRKVSKTVLIKPRADHAWVAFATSAVTSGSMGVCTFSAGNDVFAVWLYASPLLGVLLIALLARAIYRSRTDTPVEMMRTYEVEMEHPNNSPETLY